MKSDYYARKTGSKPFRTFNLADGYNGHHKTVHLHYNKGNGIIASYDRGYHYFRGSCMTSKDEANKLADWHERPICIGCGADNVQIVHRRCPDCYYIDA